jgi:hypothetical protein
MEESSAPEDLSNSVWINEGHIVFRALDVGRALTTGHRCAAGEFPRWSGGAVAASLPNPPVRRSEPC